MAVSVSGEKNQDWKAPAENKTPASKAVEAKKPFNGPHSAKAMKKLAEEKAAIQKAELGDKAYHVDVHSKNESTDDQSQEKPKLTYTPEEVRAKAKNFMFSGNLTPEERRVLKEILGPDPES